MTDAAASSDAKDHFDVDHDFIAHLNGECHDWAGMDGDALQQALRAQGEEWHALMAERCPVHVFRHCPFYFELHRAHALRPIDWIFSDALFNQSEDGFRKARLAERAHVHRFIQDFVENLSYCITLNGFG